MALLRGRVRLGSVCPYCVCSRIFKWHVFNTCISNCIARNKKQKFNGMKQMEVIVRNGLPVVSMNEKRSMTMDKYEWIGETCEYERERKRERKWDWKLRRKISSCFLAPYQVWRKKGDRTLSFPCLMSKNQDRDSTAWNQCADMW